MSPRIDGRLVLKRRMIAAAKELRRLRVTPLSRRTDLGGGGWKYRFMAKGALPLAEKRYTQTLRNYVIWHLLDRNGNGREFTISSENQENKFKFSGSYKTITTAERMVKQIAEQKSEDDSLEGEFGKDSLKLIFVPNKDNPEKVKTNMPLSGLRCFSGQMRCSRRMTDEIASNPLLKAEGNSAVNPESLHFLVSVKIFHSYHSYSTFRQHKVNLGPIGTVYSEWFGGDMSRVMMVLFSSSVWRDLPNDMKKIIAKLVREGWGSPIDEDHLIDTSDVYPM